MEYNVVAFLDVLGFSHMVQYDAKSSEPRFLPIFRAVIEKVRETFSGDAALDVRMFSDSIVVSAPLNPGNLSQVIEACADLQRKFLENEILLRGGISFGKHYSDDAVMFSDALISAYELESKKARFPRILVDDNIYDIFINHPDLTDDLRNSVHRCVRKDRDGRVFVHYLFADDLEYFTEKIKSVFTNARVAEESVLEKMRWLHDYYSYCVASSSKPELDIIDFKSGFKELN